jgi:GDP/UDP-N,N'-diacetylbacillosamine 2-epimerase (hydrolysing)
MKPRHICYLSGTRADFGLMVSTLRLVNACPELSLSVLVTGMHLSPQYGLTVQEIESEGFRVMARVPCDMELTNGAQMARNIGVMLQGFVDVLQAERPDVLLLLGDRGEMLAGALAASHLGIPVVHLHGGERSGTVDEPVRHAISKLSHLHLVATHDARERLIRMGERADHVHVVGAPGLDGLTNLVVTDREQLCSMAGFKAADKLALLIFHPVLQEAGDAGRQMRLIAQGLCDANYQVFALMPNSDAGSQDVAETLRSFEASGRFVVKTHLPRSEFVAWMACVDVMVGNSSSGIIEAASFGTPVLNFGIRQNMRERNANVSDVEIASDAFSGALGALGPRGLPPYVNAYGDGKAGPRIVDFLLNCDLGPDLLNKCNAY